MTYTVLIKSNDKNSGTIANSKYYFDWSIFENVKYKVFVEFVTSKLTTTFAKVPSLYIELGQSSTFSVHKTLIQAQTSQFVGQLYKVETKDNSYLITHTQFDGIELLHRPNVNDFTVRIINDDETPFFTEAPFSYTLKLTFEEAD
jgi:hypothetical protein